MSSALPIVNPDDLPWVTSPRASGCSWKKLYAYGVESMGYDGRAELYTQLYRFDAGASYPALRVVEGAVEIWVLQGALDVNSERVGAGAWVRLGPDEQGYSLGSTDGCEILAIVRGGNELVGLR